MHAELFAVLPPPFSKQAPWEVLAAEEEEGEEGEEEEEEEGREEGGGEQEEGRREGRRAGGGGEGMEIRPVVVVGDEGTLEK